MESPAAPQVRAGQAAPVGMPAGMPATPVVPDRSMARQGKATAAGAPAPVGPAAGAADTAQPVLHPVVRVARAAHRTGRRRSNLLRQAPVVAAARAATRVVAAGEVLGAGSFGSAPARRSRSS